MKDAGKEASIDRLVSSEAKQATSHITHYTSHRPHNTSHITQATSHRCSQRVFRSSLVRPFCAVSFINLCLLPCEEKYLLGLVFCLSRPPQRKFEAVQSMHDPNLLASFASRAPYHADALLQLGMVFAHTGQASPLAEVQGNILDAWLVCRTCVLPRNCECFIIYVLPLQILDLRKIFVLVCLSLVPYQDRFEGDVPACMFPARPPAP